MTRIRETQNDYGVLNEMSRGLNQILGDQTGRTVTQRTQDGLYNLTEGRVDMSGAGMHTVMIGSAACLASNNAALKVVGTIGLATVILSWLAGKEDQEVVVERPPRYRARSPLEWPVSSN